MFRQQSTYPLHDTSLSPDAEKGQIALLHNIEKRCQAIVTKLGRWGGGVQAKVLKEYLNKLLKVNFNDNHIRYALEWLVNNDCIGKRGKGETALYYAYATTPARWAKARKAHKR